MPTSVGPNTKGEENIVFGYDLGDTRNSFKNPPSTNLVHVDVARGTTSGWDGYSVHTGFGLISNGNVEKDGRPDTVSVTWLGSADRTGDWYPRFNLRNPDGSAVTTTGGEVFYASWEYKYEGEEFLTSGPPDFTTENFYGDGWKNGVHGSITTLRTKNLPFGWKRRTARIVAGDSGTTQTPLYRFGSGYKQASGGNFTLWLDNIIITRDHPTKRWYPGQTSVSSTQGLRDLKRNSTINLSSVSFDEKGNMTFDGTDDILNTGIFSGRNPSTDPFTIEAWVKSDTTSGARMWIDATGNGNGQRFYSALIDSTTSASGIQGAGWGDSTPSHTNWSHQVIVMDGSTGHFYADGQLKYQINYTSYTLSGQLNIGGRASYRWLGDISKFKAYDRALTPAEVRKNYNATKGRFRN